MQAEFYHTIPTDKTPEVLLNPEGIIKIKGRCLILNKTKVAEEIMSWIKEYLDNPAEETTVIIGFEYLNSFGASILISMLREFSKVILKRKKLVIRWYYEGDDDDLLERGKQVSSSLSIPFEYILTDDIAII